MIEEIAAEGRVVLVTASPQTRERRVATTRELSERNAADAIEESDSGRRDYFRRFYDIDNEQPTDYDFVVNSDLLSTQQIAGMVVSAATA